MSNSANSSLKNKLLRQLVTSTLLIIGVAQLSVAESVSDTPTSSTATDSIRIPVGQQGTDKQDIAKPTLGMSMAQVRNLFGEPQAEQAARGTPPISRWEYESFVVYFERNAVIHSVLKK